MNDENKTKTAEKRVLCSFCNVEWPSSAIGEHLMLCGNKTDQCPNCRKYIRRAVFAYHYENNCANLDESEGEVRRDVKKPDNSLTFLPTTSEPRTASSRQSDSAFCESNKITTTCLFCRQECEIGERNIHQEKCVQNPDNIRKNGFSHYDGASNQNSNRFYDVNQLDDIANIPCEICDEPIQSCYYIKHLEACAKREAERIQNQAGFTDQENQSFYPPCKHCNEERTTMFLKIHEAVCFMNPRRLAMQARFKDTFCFSPTSFYFPLPY